MAIVFMEGFENKEPVGRSSMSYNGPVMFPPGRIGGFGVKGAGTNSTVNTTLSVATPPMKEYTISCAHVIDAYGGYPTTIFEGASFQVVRTSTGQLGINCRAVPYWSEYILAAGEWARIDLVAKQHQTAGYFQLWVNGVKWLDMSGLDTRDASSDPPLTVVQFLIGGNAPSGGGRYNCTTDDIYITDTTGPAPANGRLGDVRIETIVPNGNGSISELVGSDGNSVDNYALVDELPGSPTDYVTGSLGARDLYSMSNLSIASGTVFATQTHVLASKTDSGAAELIPVTKVNGTEADDTTLGLGLVQGYGAGAIQTTDPSGQPWTVAKVNSAEFGVRVG